MSTIDVAVPDIGDFSDVPVIEILVNVGDTVAPEDPLVTLESDKATMDVPAPAAGTVKELKVKLNDKVSEGSVLLTLDAADVAPGAATPTPEPVPASAQRGFRCRQLPRLHRLAHQRHPLRQHRRAGLACPRDRRRSRRLHRRLPGRRSWHEGDARGALPDARGVCLNVGCIPSKALLHAARVITEAQRWVSTASRSPPRRSS